MARLIANICGPSAGCQRSTVSMPLAEVRDQQPTSHCACEMVAGGNPAGAGAAGVAGRVAGGAEDWAESGRATPTVATMASAMAPAEMRRSRGVIVNVLMGVAAAARTRTILQSCTPTHTQQNTHAFAV